MLALLAHQIGAVFHEAGAHKAVKPKTFGARKIIHL